MPGPARILVVDDEARIAEVVRSYLEVQGHSVDRAAAGEALAAAASRRKLGDDARSPQLVLTVDGRGRALAEDQR